MRSILACLGIAMLGISIANTKINSLDGPIGQRASGSYKFTAMVSKPQGADVSSAIVTNTQSGELINVLVSPSVRLTNGAGLATITISGSSRSLISWSKIADPLPKLGVVIELSGDRTFAKVESGEWYFISGDPSLRYQNLLGRTVYGPGRIDKVDP
jgi:hypothetical protein